MTDFLNSYKKRNNSNLLANPIRETLLLMRGTTAKNQYQIARMVGRFIELCHEPLPVPHGHSQAPLLKLFRPPAQHPEA